MKTIFIMIFIMLSSNYFTKYTFERKYIVESEKKCVIKYLKKISKSKNNVKIDFYEQVFFYKYVYDPPFYIRAKIKLNENDMSSNCKLILTEISVREPKVLDSLLYLKKIEEHLFIMMKDLKIGSVDNGANG